MPTFDEYSQESPPAKATDQTLAEQVVQALGPLMSEQALTLADLVGAKLARLGEEVLRAAGEQVLSRDRFLAGLWSDTGRGGQGSAGVVATQIAAFLANEGYEPIRPASGTPFDGRSQFTSESLVRLTTDPSRDRTIERLIRPGWSKGAQILLRPLVSVFRLRPAAPAPRPAKPKPSNSAEATRVSPAA